MTEEEELKNLLNAKLSQGEVPFDEENWEHAEKLIDDSRKKKKRRRWAIIFFIGLGAGIAVMLPFALHSYKNNSDNTDTNQIQPIKQSTDTSLKENNSPASVKENNNAITAQKADSVPAHAALPEATNSASAASELKENKGKTATTDIAVIPAKHKSTNTAQANNNESSMGASPAEASVKTTATKKKTVTLTTNSNSTNEPKAKMSPTVKTGNSPTSSKDTSAALASVKLKETQKEKLVKNKAIADTTPVVTTSKPAEKQTQTAIAKRQTDTVPKKNDAAIVSKKQEPVSQNRVEANTDSTQAVATQKKQEEIQKQAQVNTDSVQKASETAAAIKKDSAAKKADTTKTVTPQPDKPQTAEKDVLSVEAGTNFVTGWSYGSTTEGRGFNPVIGIGYTRIINPTWSVHTGVLFNTIGYLSSSTYTDSHTNYDFGYTAKDTSITTKWLYYITVPLQLQYHLNEKNYIGLGGTLSYLINSSGTITTYDQNSFTVTNKQTVAQTGYYNGFNSWNATVTALYGRKLTNRLSASLTAYFGLMDIKSNSVFAEQKFERETGLRILVSYNIFQ